MCKNGYNLVLGIMYGSLSELSDLSLTLQRRSMSVSEANKCVLRTIIIYESMVNHPGQKADESNANAEMKFKNVKLTNNKAVPKINVSQFYRSFANNLNSRLLHFNFLMSFQKSMMNFNKNMICCYQTMIYWILKLGLIHFTTFSMVIIILDV